MKKRGFDHRQEPEEETPARNNRVDRVFVATSAVRREPSQVAAELLATTRAPTMESTADAELGLRRQLSRLQRQLAELQRELANKDDDVAAEVEKRREKERELDEERGHRLAIQAQVDDLLAYQLRTAGIEQRLQEALASADELAQLNERERAATLAALARVDDVTRTFEDTRALWNAERSMLEERSTTEIAQLDAQRKAAVEASAEALNAQAVRLREAHEAQLADVRATYEQSLASLRGDLEPKALQAHSLAEDRERLIAEVSAVRNEAMRDIVELEASHRQEQAQAAELHASEIASLTRAHAAELARIAADRDQQMLALQQALKAAEAREATVEGHADALRQTLKNTQRRITELEEKVSALEADKRSSEEATERERHVIQGLFEEKRQLHVQLEAATNEARRNAQERHRFVAYLEEGLAMLGALPPQPEPPIIELEPDPD